MRGPTLNHDTSPSYESSSTVNWPNDLDDVRESKVGLISLIINISGALQHPDESLRAICQASLLCKRHITRQRASRQREIFGGAMRGQMRTMTDLNHASSSFKMAHPLNKRCVSFTKIFSPSTFLLGERMNGIERCNSTH